MRTLVAASGAALSCDHGLPSLEQLLLLQSTSSEVVAPGPVSDTIVVSTAHLLLQHAESSQIRDQTCVSELAFGFLPLSYRESPHDNNYCISLAVIPKSTHFPTLIQISA